MEVIEKFYFFCGEKCLERHLCQTCLDHTYLLSFQHIYKETLRVFNQDQATLSTTKLTGD